MRRFSILVPLVLVLLASVVVFPAHAAPAQADPAATPPVQTLTGSVDAPETMVGWGVANVRASAGRTQLADGRVLITGGREQYRCNLTEAAVIDPTNNALTPIAPMNEGRAHHTSTLLFDGRVLLGRGTVSENTTRCGSVLPPFEVFDPATDTFAVVADTGALPPPATLLFDQRLATIRDGIIQTYNPATATAGISGTLQFVHSNYVLTALADGRVLLSDLDATTPSEIYDPTTGNVTPVGTMQQVREAAVSVLLADGRVMVISHELTDNVSNPRSAYAEEFEPATGEYVRRGTLGEVFDVKRATLLADGRVVVIGRRHIVVFDPVTLRTRTLTGVYLRGSAVRNLDGSLLIFWTESGGIQASSVLRYAPANHFAGTLTLPGGWVNTPRFKVGAVASTTGAPIEAIRVNDSGWQPVTAGQPISLTVTAYESTSNPWYSLYARDTNGLVSVLVDGQVKVDLTPPQSQMLALPMYSSNTIQLRWSYSDARSGVRTVAVEVREGTTGVWRRVIDGTLATSTTFSGSEGVTYFFRVRAVDQAGNVEAWPDTYDISTRVGVGPKDQFEVYLPLVRR